MKTVMIIAFCAVSVSSHAEVETAAAATSGRFTVTQEHRGDYVETVRFSNPEFPAVRLSGLPWPGIYSISPDEQWLLRTQKTGSGDSVAMLYHVEENGRVSEMQGFNELLWRFSDTISRLKQTELYHTGVSDFAWSDSSPTLTLVLAGSNAAKSGDGIESRIIYDMKTNRVTTETKEANETVGKPLRE